MKKVKLLSPVVILLFLIIFSCKDDDDDFVVVPPHDRSEEAIIAEDEIVEFLETHFYNYEEFESPTIDFDYKIKFDTISGDNSSKTPLMEQVLVKEVKDVFEEEVVYNLYYLKVNQGEGDKIEFTDITTLSYEGRFVKDLTLFDSSVAPVRFDLTEIINGLQSALIEFNGASDFFENGDGTVSFENFGNGAVFIPSGLGYFDSPPTAEMPSYSQLMFTFQAYLIEKGDQDNDGILSVFEDLDGDGFEGNDDTDGDHIPNFVDTDDDGDGRLTKNEIEANTYVILEGETDPILGENEVEMYREFDDETGEITIYTVDFIDVNNDGIPDYLDDSL